MGAVARGLAIVRLRLVGERAGGETIPRCGNLNKSFDAGCGAPPVAIQLTSYNNFCAMRDAGRRRKISAAKAATMSMFCSRCFTDGERATDQLERCFTQSVTARTASSNDFATAVT